MRAKRLNRPRQEDSNPAVQAEIVNHLAIAYRLKRPWPTALRGRRGRDQPGVTCATGITPRSSRLRPLLAITCLYQSNESLGSRFWVW